jgi:hypothetical protein
LLWALTVTPVQSSSSASSKLGNLAGLASIAGVCCRRTVRRCRFVLYTEGLVAARGGYFIVAQSGYNTVFRARWNASKDVSSTWL